VERFLAMAASSMEEQIHTKKGHSSDAGHNVMSKISDTALTITNAGQR
jgi:hypothetical protein